jgi:hypothetical protein
VTGILLDSGPLVLFIYATLDQSAVGKGKTKQHSLGIANQLIAEINKYKRHVSLPNVLTEASNHLGAGRQEFLPNSARLLSNYINSLEEIYQPSRDVSVIAEYARVGLTDAAILSCTPRLLREDITVVTQDFELFGRLCDQSVNCVNIMHWGTPNG